MPRSAHHAFTLVELLVVVAIMALLLGVLIPAMSRARDTARVAACAASLHTVGHAVHVYANDFRGAIPFGPNADAATSTNFYPVTGFITSLLSREAGDPIGLGLLLDRHLAHKPEVLFCPGADSALISEAQLQLVGRAQSQSSYWYRHGSAIRYVQNPVTGRELVQNDHIRLADLGANRDGAPIRALAMDTNFLADPSLQSFGVVDITHHDRQTTNVLLADGGVEGRSNADERYTVDVGALPHFGPRMILDAFENADADR